jgi:pimeloyl-ACP methyl ester carboxylesterase
MNALRRPHVVHLGGSGAETVFCVDAPDGVTWHRELVRQLAPELAVYGITADLRTQPPLAAVAGRYLRQLRRVQAAGPYHLVGWSAGGLLAYEMACQLRRLGQPVGSVAVLNAQRPVDSAAGRRAVALAHYQPSAYDGAVDLFTTDRGDAADGQVFDAVAYWESLPVRVITSCYVPGGPAALAGPPGASRVAAAIVAHVRQGQSPWPVGGGPAGSLTTTRGRRLQRRASFMPSCEAVKPSRV